MSLGITNSYCSFEVHFYVLEYASKVGVAGRGVRRKGTGTDEVKSSATERGWIFLGIHHSESTAERANARVKDNISLVNSKQLGNMRSVNQGNGS